MTFAIMVILACGPGVVFAIGSWAVFRPGGPRLGGRVQPHGDDDYEHGDLGA